MEKLTETKVLRDPIHNYIHIDYPVIWELIDTKEFQRLRRIHQLGGTFMVFHTAEHTRFGHCLGVYEIVRRMVNEISDLNDILSEDEKIIVMIAGLLHDLGHGPFSHAFESVCQIDHEEMTVRIIKEDSEVNKVLRKYGENIPDQVASIINHTHPNKLLIQLVSSQLDADRMDYLLRDSYFTGTTYGEFDLERVIRTLKVIDHQLVVKETGIHTVEDYIMARYHMYWQVYYHPTARSFEALLVLIFKRLVEHSSAKEYPMFEGLFKGKDIGIDDHYLLDEYTCYYGFQLMSKGSDPVLKDLAKRILSRDLLDYKDIQKGEQLEDYLCLSKDYDSNYYLYRDSAKQLPYRPYSEQDENLIKVYTKTGIIKELSSESNIVEALTKGKSKEDYKIFYPK